LLSFVHPYSLTIGLSVGLCLTLDLIFTSNFYIRYLPMAFISGAVETSAVVSAHASFFNELINALKKETPA